jgi:hypothetical protein
MPFLRHSGTPFIALQWVWGGGDDALDNWLRSASDAGPTELCAGVHVCRFGEDCCHGYQSMGKARLGAQGKVPEAWFPPNTEKATA